MPHYERNGGFSCKRKTRIIDNIINFRVYFFIITIETGIL